MKNKLESFGIYSVIAFEYIKNLFNTPLKDWTYINLIVACLTIISGVFIYVYGLSFLLDIGLLWLILLIGSITCFKFAGRSREDDNKAILKVFSGLLLIITFFVIFFS